MRWMLLIVSFCLGACDSPGIGFAGAEVTRVDRGGAQFSLRRTGNHVQIIRTNFMRRPDIGQIGQDAELAVEASYGCPVTKMHGDVALMVAQIDCDKRLVPGQWARWVKPKRAQSSCIGDLLAGASGQREAIEFRCL